MDTDVVYFRINEENDKLYKNTLTNVIRAQKKSYYSKSPEELKYDVKDLEGDEESHKPEQMSFNGISDLFYQ